MDRIRAKFTCTEATPTAHGMGRNVTLRAVYDAELAEDQSFAKATPSATVEMYVDNPDAVFEPGAAYYVDFTKVDA